MSGPGRETVRVYALDAGRVNSFDVHRAAYRRAQAQTVLVLLRETRLRVEELAELTVQNVAPFIDGDVTIPVLNVNPSKQDRSRTVGLPPPAPLAERVKGWADESAAHEDAEVQRRRDRRAGR